MGGAYNKHGKGRNANKGLVGEIEVNKRFSLIWEDNIKNGSYRSEA
jgi:hypothetical protein